jgi:hypothetical protein
VVVGENGTRFLGSNDPADSTKWVAKRTERDSEPSRSAIAAQEARDQEQVRRELRNFVSMCASSWLKGELTLGHPKAPRPLAAVVSGAGGNIKWLSASKERRALFHEMACRQSGRAILFSKIWASAGIKGT